MKKMFSKLHLWLSVPVGIFITVICLSGAALVFEQEIKQWLNRDIYASEHSEGQERMRPSEIIAAVKTQVPDTLRISGLTVPGREGLSYAVTFEDMHRRPLYVDPYTGEVKVTVVYTFNDDNELIIDYLATTNKKTIINLTSHGYFSLAGIANPTPTIDNLVCEINADYYLPIDETAIPTGEIRFVKDTPFDFRQPKPIGQDINADNEQIKNGAGYDHCFVLNKKEEGELSFAARVTEPVSGRVMDVYTTEPGVQFYTDNWADGYKGQHGATFPKRSAVCFEAQHFPDSPNHPYFPSVILRPGEQYKQKTIYKFGVVNK